MLTTRRKNSLALCKRIAEQYEKRYKEGKRPQVIYEELSAVYCLSIGTIRNKRFQWMQLDDELKKLF